MTDREKMIEVINKYESQDEEVSAAGLADRLIEAGFGRVNPLTQAWKCAHCNQFIPYSQYHDCKNGTKL